MIDALQYFHFLRPFWLAAIPVIIVLWALVRPRRRSGEDAAKGIAPHLAAALSVGAGETRRLFPIDGVAVAGLLLALAVAGPAWNRLPNPLIAETAPLVVALKVSPSMETPDVAPTRLDRARFKILDLVAARAGARTALVAYAGTAHGVAPLTEDPNILRPLLEGLSPDVMPVAGDNASGALDLARSILDTADTPGALLFVLDDLNPADVPAFAAVEGAPLPAVVFLVVAPERVALPQLERIGNATVVRITPDDTDIRQIERNVRSAHAAALAADDRLAWDDRGWMLLWPVMFLALVWFRRGWTMRWAVVAFLGTSIVPAPVQAEGWADWFMTPDQQGRLAFERKEYSRAGGLFEDPMWAGYARFRAGEYIAAAEIFARLDTAEAAFAEGMARIRGREYRPGVRAFEAALARRPEFPEAERNLEIARAIVEYVETAREQSDTGEESGIGADEVVFDNESSRGAQTQIEAPSEEAAPLTSEQWLQSIDTDMSAFLRSRFLLENAGRGQ